MQMMSHQPTTELQDWALKFQTEFFTKYPDASKSEVISAIQMTLKLVWPNDVDVKLLECISILFKKENPFLPQASDTEGASASCPHFEEHHHKAKRHSHTFDTEVRKRNETAGPSTSSSLTTKSGESGKKRKYSQQWKPVMTAELLHKMTTDDQWYEKLLKL